MQLNSATHKKEPTTITNVDNFQDPQDQPFGKRAHSTIDRVQLGNQPELAPGQSPDLVFPS